MVSLNQFLVRLFNKAPKLVRPLIKFRIDRILIKNHEPQHQDLNNCRNKCHENIISEVVDGIPNRILPQAVLSELLDVIMNAH